MYKLRSIQVLRALAASSVVFFHAYLVSGKPQPRAWEMQLGAAGVDLFFVISGFIIATVARGRQPGEFLADRCWRIYPLWWAAAIPELIRDGSTPKQLATSLSLWPVWDGSYTFPLPEVGWTLGFEMMFYVAVAVALVSRPAVPIALYAIAAILGQAMSIPLFGFVGSPMVLEFLLGVCISRLPRDSRFGAVFVGFAFAGFAAAPVDYFSMYVAERPHAALSRVLFWGVPAASLAYGCLCIDKRFSLRIFNLPVLLGDASYSIYLFHLTVMGALPSGWHWATLALFSIAGGVIIHLALEKRIPEFRKALRERRLERRNRRALAHDHQDLAAFD